MRKPIIVGVDPLHEDDEPLALASLLGRIADSPVVGIAAYPHDGLSSRPDDADVERVLREDAEAALVRAAARLPAGTIAHAVPSDSGAGALLSARIAHDSGLIVVGSAHRGPIGRLALGSVADGVLGGATVPVAIAPRGYQPPPGGLGRVGAAFVDTAEGRAALRAAAAVAVGAGAALQAITVVEWFDPIGEELAADMREQAVELVEHAVEHATAGLPLPVRTESVAIAGTPARELIERSRQLDLLVCGSRGHGPLATVMLGSVSRALAHHAHCPLIVIPRGMESAFEEFHPDHPARP